MATDDPPLVDPETGETAPLSPKPLTVTQAYDRARSLTLDQFFRAAMLSPVEPSEPDDAA